MNKCYYVPKFWFVLSCLKQLFSTQIIPWTVFYHNPKPTQILSKSSPKNSFCNSHTSPVKKLVTFCPIIELYASICKVKPLYNDHPWDTKIVFVVDRWSLYISHFYNNGSNWDLNMLVILDRWLLFGGGH